MVIAASAEFGFCLLCFLGDSSPVMAFRTSALDLGFDLAGFLVAGGRSRFGSWGPFVPREWTYVPS